MVSQNAYIALVSKKGIKILSHTRVAFRLSRRQLPPSAALSVTGYGWHHRRHSHLDLQSSQPAQQPNSQRPNDLLNIARTRARYVIRHMRVVQPFVDCATTILALLANRDQQIGIFLRSHRRTLTPRPTPPINHSISSSSRSTAPHSVPPSP